MRPIKPVAIAILIAALLLLFSGGKVPPGPGPGPVPVPVPVVNAPFKTDKLAFAFFYDADPNALKALQAAHPGIADMMASRAEGTVRKAVESKGGDWRLVSKASSEPTLDLPWVQAAYKAWKDKGGTVPWIMAAGPLGSGFSTPPPETQAEAVKLWEAVK